MAVFVAGQHRTDYGHIRLTTENVLHPAEKVANTPTRADGISKEVRTHVTLFDLLHHHRYTISLTIHLYIVLCSHYGSSTIFIIRCYF